MQGQNVFAVGQEGAEIIGKTRNHLHSLFVFFFLDQPHDGVKRVIKKMGIVDVVVVVTRYFGGIMLGAGGLVRAYSHGASIALAAANPVTMRLCKECSVTCTYNQYGKVSSLIPNMGGIIDNSDFGEGVEIFFHIPQGDFDKLNKELADATSGEVRAKSEREHFYAE